MLRWLRLLTAGTPEQRANGLAALIACSAVGFLYLEAPPIPAGANSPRVAQSRPAPLKLDRAPAEQALANIVEPTPLAADTGSPTDQAEQTLRRKLELLERGRKFLSTIPDYTAQFAKQELVNGELLEEQEIYLKCRHQPFSIYLKWLSGDAGREVIYVDGANGGDMIVHAGGWKARLPALSISPSSSLAMKESRYPVTNAGLLALINTMLTVHTSDLSKHNVTRCEQLADEEFDSRPCSVFVVEYKNKELSPTYRKSVVLIDKEWNVPLYTRNFGWPDAQNHETDAELDDATLIEYYTYSDIQFCQQLAELDFDRANEDYRFR